MADGQRPVALLLRSEVPLTRRERACLERKSTLHESAKTALREGMKAGERKGAGRAGEETPDETEIPCEQQEALVLEHMVRHCRAWIDEPLPALRGETPLAAARNEVLRPKVVDLVRGLETIYENALRRGDPAYHSSWMWSELGLRDRTLPVHPPPLAAERMEALIPGLGELCRAVAARVRSQPGFDDKSTVLAAEEVGSNLEIQRFLRAGSHGPDNRASALLVDPLRWLVEYQTHRCKTLWVDESPAYMLAKKSSD
jgi:hypothetical protein